MVKKNFEKNFSWRLTEQETYIPIFVADEAVKRIIIDLIPESKPFFEVMPEYDGERQTVILDPGLVQKAFWEIIQWGSEANTVDVKSIIDTIPNELKSYGKCDEFAQKLVSSLDKKGVSYNIIRVDSRFGIYSDKAEMSIGIGYHYGVQVGDIVYDNMTTDGIPLDVWLHDLGIGYGYDSIKWKYTDTITNR
ncbi:MAG: hypothetical protein HFI34_09375 [Lachnospiraceae bacterium]|nr:hypothetical protein [Lachnospiraceae bacterium]